MRPTVVVTEGLEDKPLAFLKDHADVLAVGLANESGLRAAMAKADAVIVRTYTRVNEAFLQTAPRLRVVGRAGVGLENIDLAACRARNVAVVSTPNANTHAVCEYVFNLILHLGRPLFALGDPVAPEAFHRYRKTSRGLELHGKTMGILGMGRIGRSVGKVANAFGMTVLYNDLLDVASQVSYPASPVDKKSLFAEADVLTVHVDFRPENRHMLNAEVFSAMKPTALIVNTSRGEVINADDLAAAIRAKRVAGAALDVHDPEPPPADYPLWGFENVLLLPHLAARTHGAMEAMSWVVKDVLAALEKTETA